MQEFTCVLFIPGTTGVCIDIILGNFGVPKFWQICQNWELADFYFGKSFYNYICFSIHHSTVIGKQPLCTGNVIAYTWDITSAVGFTCALTLAPLDISILQNDHTQRLR